jgi:hypothetical protein
MTKTTEEIQRALENAAEKLDSTATQPFALLLPFRDQIRLMRSKGAPFETIAEILGQHELPVSRETVRRFCREILREKPRRSRKPLMPSLASPAANGSNSSETKPCSPNTANPALPNEQSASALLTQRREALGDKATAPRRGPRIADLSTL